MDRRNKSGDDKVEYGHASKSWHAFSLLPSWEKADAAKRRPDEGAVQRDGRFDKGDAPSPASGLTALASPSPTRGEGEL